MAVSRSSRWAASWARFLYVEYFSISPGCFSPSFSSPDETACEQNRGVEGTLGPEASAGGQQDTWLPGCLCHRPVGQSAAAPHRKMKALHQVCTRTPWSLEHTGKESQTTTRRCAGSLGTKRHRRKPEGSSLDGDSYSIDKSVSGPTQQF